MWAGHQCLCTLFATLLCQFPGPMRLGCLSHPSTPCPGWGGDTNIFRVSLFLFFWPVPDCLKCTNIISLVKWVNPVHLPLGYCAGDSWGAFCNIHGQSLCPSCRGWGGGLHLSPGSTEFSILWQATTAWLYGALRDKTTSKDGETQVCRDLTQHFFTPVQFLVTAYFRNKKRHMCLKPFWLSMGLKPWILFQ
jgi:hypothetical protein